MVEQTKTYSIYSLWLLKPLQIAIVIVGVGANKHWLDSIFSIYTQYIHCVFWSLFKFAIVIMGVNANKHWLDSIYNILNIFIVSSEASSNLPLWLWVWVQTGLQYYWGFELLLKYFFQVLFTFLHRHYRKVFLLFVCCNVITYYDHISIIITLIAVSWNE